MLARYPHPLLQERGMPIPQPTPGQPNPFSAYSVPSVTEHPSQIPQCPASLMPWCLDPLASFRKNKAKNKIGKMSPGLLPPRQRMPESSPLVPQCLNASAPFRKNKPNLKMERLPCPLAITYLSTRSSMPQCLAPFRKNKANGNIGKSGRTPSPVGGPAMTTDRTASIPLPLVDEFLCALADAGDVPAEAFDGVATRAGEHGEQQADEQAGQHDNSDVFHGSYPHRCAYRVRFGILPRRKHRKRATDGQTKQGDGGCMRRRRPLWPAVR